MRDLRGIIIYACGALIACSNANDGMSDQILSGGSFVATGGVAQGTGGVLAATGGTSLATGGVISSTGGVISSTGGMDQGGTGGVISSTGGVDQGTGGTSDPPQGDLGEGDGQDVITIGDSWMLLLVTGIQVSLENVSGRDYRNYAFPGTLILNEQIPNQYEQAKSEDPDIKTVVMTGGGNDILTSSCVDTDCNAIVDQVSARLDTLFAEMATDGVEDVFLIGYTYPSDQTKHASLDHSIELDNMKCTLDTMPRCHFLDSSMLDLTLADGIHPDSAGFDLLGATVWDMMQSSGARR